VTNVRSEGRKEVVHTFTAEGVDTNADVEQKIEVKYEERGDLGEVKIEEELREVFGDVEGNGDGGSGEVTVKEEYGTGVGLKDVDALLEVLDRVDGVDEI